VGALALARDALTDAFPMPRQRRFSHDGLDSLEAGLAVLEVIGTESPQLSLTEISSRLGLYKSRVFRILQTLKRRGFVGQAVKGGPYHLGWKVLELAHVLTESHSLLTAAAPVLSDLSRELRGTVVLRVLQGDEQLTLQCVHSPEILRTSFPVGARTSATYGSTGKALLAFLPPTVAVGTLERAVSAGKHVGKPPDQFLRELATIRRTGYAINLEETVQGVRGVAAPVLNRNREALAAIAASFPAAALPRHRIPEVARQVREAALRIGVRLGQQAPISATSASRPAAQLSGSRRPTRASRI